MVQITIKLTNNKPCNPLEAPALKGLFQRKKPIIEIAALLYTLS